MFLQNNIQKTHTQIAAATPKNNDRDSDNCSCPGCEPLHSRRRKGQWTQGLTPTGTDKPTLCVLATYNLRSPESNRHAHWRLRLYVSELPGLRIYQSRSLSRARFNTKPVPKYLNIRYYFTSVGGSHPVLHIVIDRMILSLLIQISLFHSAFSTWNENW
jgi:hypothetical protein